MESYFSFLVVLVLTLGLTLTSTKAECGSLASVECTQGVQLDFGQNDTVTCDQTLNTTTTQSQPSITLSSGSGFGQNEEVLVALLDADAPSKSNCSTAYYLHWMMTAFVQDNYFMKPKIQLVEYERPISFTSAHRYQLMMYKQQNEEFPTNVTTQRRDFDLATFTSTWNLTSPTTTFQFKILDD